MNRQKEQLLEMFGERGDGTYAFRVQGDDITEIAFHPNFFRPNGTLMERLARVINEPGPSPSYHSSQLRHIREFWPPLRDVLVTLLEQHHERVPPEWRRK